MNGLGGWVGGWLGEYVVWMSSGYDDGLMGFWVDWVDWVDKIGGCFDRFIVREVIGLLRARLGRRSPG